MQNKNQYEKLELLTDTSQIKIQVKDPQLDQAGGYTSYLLIGTDKLGSFEIRRRYNEFHFLRQGLIKRWPGCYVPPIPPKKVTGNTEEKFIEDRKRSLNYFAVKVSGIKYLYYSQIFQQFIRNKSTSIESMVSMMSQLPSAQIADCYKSIFGAYLNIQNTNELKTKINNFAVYLKKSHKELQPLIQEVKEIAEAKSVFNANLNVCTMILMPEYEKDAFIQYVNQQQNNLLFANDNYVVQKSRQLKENMIINPYDYLVDLVSFQSREVEALLEAFQCKNSYQQKKKKLQDKRKDQQSQLSKLMSGKTTFKSFFTKGSKNQQINLLQKSLQDDLKQIEALNILVNFITVVLGYIEINKFKNYKKIQYLQTLNQISQKQLKHYQIYGNLMKGLMI